MHDAGKDLTAHLDLSLARASLGTKRPDLPHEFTDIVDRALALEPAQRYESAFDMEAP